MLVLHLRKLSDPDTDIQTRSLGADPIVLGRDETADWVMPEADMAVSRRHMELTPAGNCLRVTALGQNGMRLPQSDECISAGETVVLNDGDRVLFGDYCLLVRSQTASPAKSFEDHKNDQLDLLDAFLEGAGLDPSAFVIDNAADILRRAGKMYIESVCGLCELMKERNQIKERLAIEQTTISAGDNNPMRWGAPNRVAIELLRETEPGFLEGSEALRASLQDIQFHLASLDGGYKAVIDAMIERLAPKHLAAENDRTALLSGAKKKWEAYAAAHKALEEEINASSLPLSRAFASGYQTKLDAAKRGNAA
ncbi:type VI secretion system-associated FHA domain protein [Hyphococcus sp.]|uniref:type VI secretion system-associated FHA domain protein n=1 Tax=Hyphococcus sp. TaxID=2038636 RepID=UPI003CCBD873